MLEDVWTAVEASGANGIIHVYNYIVHGFWPKIDGNDFGKK